MLIMSRRTLTLGSQVYPWYITLMELSRGTIMLSTWLVPRHCIHTMFLQSLPTPTSMMITSIAPSWVVLVLPKTPTIPSATVIILP